MAQRVGRWRGVVIGLGGAASLSWLAGWTPVARDAALVLAVGAVVAVLACVAVLALVLFHDDDDPCRRLQDLLHAVRPVLPPSATLASPLDGPQTTPALRHGARRRRASQTSTTTSRQRRTE